MSGPEAGQPMPELQGLLGQEREESDLWQNIKKKNKKRKKKFSSSPSAQAEGGPASDQAGKLHAENSTRFVESAQAQLGRKPKKIL